MELVNDDIPSHSGWILALSLIFSVAAAQWVLHLCVFCFAACGVGVPLVHVDRTPTHKTYLCSTV